VTTMPPNNSNSDVSPSGLDQHSLVVLEGRQAGARAQISVDAVVTVGTDLDNDVVLYSHNADPCRLTITGSEDAIELVVVEGVVLKNGEPLATGVIHEVDISETFSMADSVFAFTFATEISHSSSASTASLDQYASSDGAVATEHAPNRSFTYLCIAGGLILLTSVVTTGLVRAFQNEDNRKQSLQTELLESGYENLHFVPPQGDLPARVSGAVFSVEDRSKILSMAADTKTNVQLDLQINEELASAVQDVYRVNGITAEVSITGIGEVEVWTSTKNEELLIAVESSVKNDVPNVISLTTSNSIPAEKVVEQSPVADVDPDKQVTLVVAGADGYLMTRDKSRYFIGSMLPSGHYIKKIENGNVYVESTDGQSLVLEFN